MDVALSVYRETLDSLFARTTGTTRLGLDRTRELLRLLGDPQHRFAALHIAGTNGKGSVAATLDTLLRGSGLRVGKYTSPHLVDFRERVTIGGRAIAEDEVVDFAHRYMPHIERVGATFFEATTALAFDAFARHAVDIAIVETGLGGRLDSTNVILPLVAGVTAIGLDHTDLLGSTLDEIATEKAGIFKPGAAAVVGERGPSIARLLRERATQAGSRSVTVVADSGDAADISVRADGTRFRHPRVARGAPLHTGLVGRHQVDNTLTALAMLTAAGAQYALSDADICAHLPRVTLPGRFDQVSPWIFDVAHNADGARVLAATLGDVQPPGPLIGLIGVLADKDWRAIVRAIAPAVDEMLFVLPPTAPEGRRWIVQDAVDFATANGWRARAEPDFDRALVLAPTLGATVVVTGSFHTVGDAMSRLQVDPLRGYLP